MSTQQPPSMQKWEPITDPFTIRRLNKTSEELNELAGRIARTLLQGWDGIDPKDGLTNREHFARETADVIAQINCNLLAFDMPMDQITERREMKEEWMTQWEAHYANDKLEARAARDVLASMVRIRRLEERARDLQIAATDAAGYRLADVARAEWMAERGKMDWFFSIAAKIVDAEPQS